MSNDHGQDDVRAYRTTESLLEGLSTMAYSPTTENRHPRRTTVVLVQVIPK